MTTPLPSHPGAPAAPLELANNAVHLTFNGAGCGLTRLDDLHAGQSFSFSASELYRIELTASSGKKQWLGAASAQNFTVEHRELNGSPELALTFTHVLADSGSLYVACQINLNAAVSEWRIRVDNATPYAIQKVCFPLVMLDARPVDADAPRFTYPYDRNADYHAALLLGLWDGMLIPEPHRNIPDDFGWQEEHPGRMGTQLSAYYDPRGGLCLFPQDGGGNPKLLGFKRSGTTLDLTPTHLFPRLFGVNTSPDYAVTLIPFQGDWQTAAALYKQWTLTQPWAQTLLSDRRDLPGWLVAGNPFLLYAQQRPGKADHSEQWRATLPDQMLPVLKAYEQWLASPLSAVIFGWEKICSWITPDVFPPYPDAVSFRTLVMGLKENGSRVFLYTSGTRWAVKNPRQPEWDGMDAWEAAGRAASCVAEDGGWAYDSRPWALNHKLCMAAQGTKDMMHAYAAGFGALGIDATQYDQNLGGETYVCFSDQHGHPPGYGRWMYDEAKQVLDTFLAENRVHNPDFAISVEEPNEVLIPHLTFYDSRAMVYHGWPLLTNMPCLGVPLFSQLYHEYAIGFEGDYHIFLAGVGVERLKLGRIVCAGHLLCDFIPADHPFAGGTLKPDAVIPPHFTLFKQAAAAYRTYAHPWLVLGQRLAEPSFEVETYFELTKTRAQSYYTDARVDYVYPESAGVKAPVVLGSAWMSPQGVPGIVFVNMSETVQRITLTWDSLGAAWQDASHNLSLVSLAGSAAVGAPRNPGATLTLDLPPLEVSLLTVKK